MRSTFAAGAHFELRVLLAILLQPVPGTSQTITGINAVKGAVTKTSAEPTTAGWALVNRSAGPLCLLTAGLRAASCEATVESF